MKQRMSLVLQCELVQLQVPLQFLGPIEDELSCEVKNT